MVVFFLLPVPPHGHHLDKPSPQALDPYVLLLPSRLANEAGRASLGVRLVEGVVMQRGSTPPSGTRRGASEASPSSGRTRVEHRPRPRSPLVTEGLPPPIDHPDENGSHSAAGPRPGPARRPCTMQPRPHHASR